MTIRRILRKLRRQGSGNAGSEFRVFELTWSIPAEFGGMTSVLLRRARNLVGLENRTVDVLTLDYKLDLSETVTRLTESEEIVPGVTVRNIWHELAGFSRRQLESLGAGSSEMAVPEAHPSASMRETARFIEYYDAEGSVERVDHRRTDGSIFLTDLRSEGARRLILFDPNGRYVGEYSRARDLYFSWLDHVTELKPSVVINESKFVGGFLHHYQRDQVKVGQVLHNTHLEPTSDSPYGPFTRSRLGVLSNWHKFDFLVFLTKKQKADFVSAFGDSPTLFVIPNCTEIVTEDLTRQSPERDVRAGAVVARLSNQKRVDQAISAVGAASDGVSLDVFGDGDLRSRLESQVDGDAVLASRVTFKGFVQNAADELADYSFILLTSAYDGLSLVLIEAMSRGCIPIAYDIRYGPSEVVDDGINGFLTHDVNGTTAAIDRLVAMTPIEIAELRKAAQRKSKEFDDEQITDRWEALFKEVVSSPEVGPARKFPKIAAERITADGSEFQLSLTTEAGTKIIDADSDYFILASRDRRFSVAFPVPPDQVLSIPAELLAQTGASPVFDAWYLHRDGRKVVRRRVLHAAPSTDTAAGEFATYATIHGNLSLKRTPAEARGH
ncbi:glycosyltransferase [Brevibacterium casei]|uniref:glycosyltransferase n=1 Tax=Brevibacterium casei TaxID=33889 RepID=UPI003EB7AE6E